MIVIRCQLFIRVGSYYVLLFIVYILRCPPVIKIDKSLTYTVCLFRPLFHSHKKKNSQKKMAQKKKANCHGWGIFGGKHKKNKSCATGIFRTPAQKRASSKR